MSSHWLSTALLGAASGIFAFGAVTASPWAMVAAAAVILVAVSLG